MLGGIRATVVNFVQTIIDVGWSGAEAIQLKWEETTSQWEVFKTVNVDEGDVFNETKVEEGDVFKFTKVKDGEEFNVTNVLAIMYP